MHKNDDFWLRKIAAFLHDPPDKAFWHDFRDVDALRFWFWSSKLREFPFYFVKMDFRKLADKGLLTGYTELERLFNEEPSLSEWVSYFLKPENFKEVIGIQFIFPDEDKRKSVIKKLKSKGELRDLFKREFHAVASSQIKNSVFGFDELDTELSSVILKHPLNPLDWLTCDNLKKHKNSLRRLIRKFLFSKLDGSSESKINFLKLWRLCPDFLLPSDTRLPDNIVRDLEVMQSALSTALVYKIDLEINFKLSEKASQALGELSDMGLGLKYYEDQQKLTLEIPLAIWKILEEIREKGALRNNKDLQNLIATGLKKLLRVHPSFLILEFGPVQKFIANARKTRDLWFSSWLISYLAWKAMKPIAEELGPDNIVYPDLYKQPLVDDWLKGLGINEISEPNLRMPTLPNTFLAIVPTGKEEHFAQKAQEKLRQTWLYLSAKVRRKVISELQKAGKDIDVSTLKAKFKDQVVKFPFNIYWLGLKWGDDPQKALDDYKKLIEPGRCWEFERLWKQIEKRVKNRNIGDTYALLVEMAQTGLKALKYRGKPDVANEPGHKCSLCGERTALTDGDPNKIGEIKAFWRKMVEAFPGHIKENEHLCAVCLVKRLAPKVILEKFNVDYHYPSTGSIALAPFVKAMMDSGVSFSSLEDAIKKLMDKQKDQKSKEAVKNFLDAHFTEGRTVPILGRIIKGSEKEGDFEPEWFYDEAFQRFYEELKHQKEKGTITESDYSQRREWAEQIEQAVKEIKNKSKEILGEKYHLPKYYAAVYLDGDNLGKWLRGEKAPKIEDVFHPEFVKHISGDSYFKDIKDLRRPVTPAIHRAISSALRDFALEVVPYVVEHHLGVVVYSGGDDTLFLMPLENLLKALSTLRKLYSGEGFVGQFKGRKFESDKGFIKFYENDRLVEIIRVMGTKATLSAGVAIAHYLDPLDITLANARKMLKRAKEEGRDRAGFKVIFHSGSERKAVVQWRFVDMMERFKDAIANENFSSRFLRTLHRDIQVFNELEDAFDAEFYKFGTRGQPDKDFADALLCSLIDARKALEIKPETFLDALLISEFIVRGEGKK